MVALIGTFDGRWKMAKELFKGDEWFWCKGEGLECFWLKEINEMGFNHGG